MDRGWFKLHRKILDSPVFDNEKLLKVWVWCLGKATYKPREILIGRQLVNLEPGQFVFGRKTAAKELKMKPSTVYDLMKMLERMKMISINSNNKYSVISVVNWGIYQGDEDDDQQQINNKSTTNQQQINTNKKVKNEKNEKKFYKAAPNKFKNFEQRVYNFDDLERKLLEQ